MKTQQFWYDPALSFVESRRAWQSRACYRAHSHPGLSVGAVDAGQSVLQVEGSQDRLLNPGDVVTIPANTVHSCNPEPGMAWSYQMLYLDLGWVEALQSEHAHLCQRRPSHLSDPVCYRRFCEVNDLLFDEVPHELKEEALIDFLGTVLFDSPPDEDQTPSWVGHLVEHLNRHCEERFAIADLAEYAGVSRTHLIRTFRRYAGLAPHAYQIDCRIKRARQMLREGEPLAELALRLGFSDQSHFQRAFRQRVSITPGEYQRQTRR